MRRRRAHASPLPASRATGAGSRRDFLVIGPSAKAIVCGAYRDAAGLEVRCHYEESIDALIRSERATDMDIARDIGAAWKQAVIDKGFTETAS